MEDTDRNNLDGVEALKSLPFFFTLLRKFFILEQKCRIVLFQMHQLPVKYMDSMSCLDPREHHLQMEKGVLHFSFRVRLVSHCCLTGKLDHVLPFFLYFVSLLTFN